MLKSRCVAPLACLAILLAACTAAAAAEAPDYLGIVRAYADAMMEHGRDTYGEVQSPLFAATLDRKTLKLPTDTPNNVSGIRSGDRTVTGANPMHDLNLYQVLYGLTRATGDARYAAEADAALKWFFEHCQSQATGIFAWGEHLGWDFRADAPLPGRDIHEYYRPWVLWERSFELAPEPCQRFALGVWQHQIADQQKGLFSRHAHYAKHGPSKGKEFPRHGGFYIATWAAAYERSRDPALLKAIDVLVAGFEGRRHEESSVIPSQTQIPHLVWPQSNLSLAIDLWDGAGKVTPELATKMRACASRTDEVFLKIPHDLSPAGKGFVASAITATLEPGDVRAKDLETKPGPGQRWYPFTNTWATGYGISTDAAIALQCLLRYQQVRLDGYRELFLATAQRYLTSDPDMSITLYPGALAEAIAVMLGAYRLTGEQKYLDRADAFGKTAADVFFKDGPLPRASSRHDHYEAITRGDTLAMELLDLWAANNKPDLDLGLIWNER
ncbi:MAG: hypothetical protein PVH68_14380 [Armatimonadota bacterium]|jgi:hypothetical protein